MWFPLKSSVLADIDELPFCFRNEADVATRPEVLFDLLAQDSWESWFPDYKGIEWETRLPRGVGSKRIIFLAGVNAKETFLAWERARRFSFSIDALSLPLVTQMMEDVRLSDNGTGGTRLVWTAAYRPRWFMRIFHPLARWIFNRMFRRAISALCDEAVKLSSRS